MTELHAIVRGRVQGVFFRSNTRQIAQEIGLTGTVRNCSDGSVEIFVQGTREQLEQFLLHLRQKTGFARIDQIESAFSAPQRQFSDFKVIR